MSVFNSIALISITITIAIIIVLVLVVCLAIPGLGQVRSGHTAPVMAIVILAPNCPYVCVMVIGITIVAMTLNEYEYKIHIIVTISLIRLGYQLGN